ncbi:hypothetical protein TREES_T100002684 [Tupaia chinensis]|uniref:Uncharacterized protein n=1 Tax=Tupaia chinensis TaxID=246437 RepID=L9L4R5_TUPCH|nr:hypothetical protein TREES_T100002684 [Tupaia chinensis]
MEASLELLICPNTSNKKTTAASVPWKLAETDHEVPGVSAVLEVGVRCHVTHGSVLKAKVKHRQVEGRSKKQMYNDISKTATDHQSTRQEMQRPGWQPLEHAQPPGRGPGSVVQEMGRHVLNRHVLGGCGDQEQSPRTQSSMPGDARHMASHPCEGLKSPNPALPEFYGSSSLHSTARYLKPNSNNILLRSLMAKCRRHWEALSTGILRALSMAEATTA